MWTCYFFYPQQKNIFILIHSVTLNTCRMFTGTDKAFEVILNIFTLAATRTAKKTLSSSFINNLEKRKKKVFKPFSSTWILTPVLLQKYIRKQQYPQHSYINEDTSAIFPIVAKIMGIMMEIITFCEVIKADRLIIFGIAIFFHLFWQTYPFQGHREGAFCGFL